MDARIQPVQQQEGAPYNWLFLPGGPGLDSSYLRPLLDALDLPGNIWLIDLPGNGTHPAPDGYNFNRWDELLLLLVRQFENPVVVGHSFGGMWPLLFPELEELLTGFVVIHGAPCLWFEGADLCARERGLNPPSELEGATLADYSPYFFPPATVEEGRAYFESIPYSAAPGGWWMEKCLPSFDPQWIPQRVPTLILGGELDCITPPTLFEDDPRFSRCTIARIPGAGHFGWIENKDAYQPLIEQWMEQWQIHS